MPINEKIVLTAEDRASRALAQAGGNFNKLEDRTTSAGVSAQKAGGAFGNFGATLKGAAFAGGAAAAVTTLGRLSFAAVQAAVDAGEAEAAFTTTFGEALPEATRFVEDFANKAGFTTSQLQQLLAVTGNVAQGIGATETESAELATTMATLAGDVASFSNAQGGAEAVMLALQSAINGEREALKTYGIAVSEAEVQTAALAATGKDSADALTRLEKAEATLTVATQKAGKAIGDLDRTQDSAANRQRQLAAQVGELQVEIGQKLLPAWEAMLDLGVKLAPAVGEVATSFADLAGTIAPVVDLVGILVEGRGEILGFLDELARAPGAVGEIGFIIRQASQSGLSQITFLKDAIGILWDEWTGSNQPEPDALANAINQADQAMKNSGVANYNADIGRLADTSEGADRALLGLVNGVAGVTGGARNAEAAFENWRRKLPNLTTELLLVAEAGGNINDVLLAAADPAFAAVTAWTSYAEALEAAKEDGISTGEELELLEERVRMEAALREAGLNWDEAMNAIATATGKPLDEVEALFGKLEDIDGRSFKASVDIETHYTTTGTPPVRSTNDTPSGVFNFAVGTWRAPGAPTDMIPATLHGTEIVIPPEGSGGRADFARQLAAELSRAGLNGGRQLTVHAQIFANSYAEGAAAADGLEERLNDYAIQGLQ